MIRIASAFALVLLAPCALAAPAKPVRVTLETEKGPITIELAMKQAPITAGNFLRYVDEKKFDGTSFYRAAPMRGAPKLGFVQGGIRHNIARSRPPIAHEPTTRTGLRHVDGTISMARGAPGSAMGDFFITVGPSPSMDAGPGKPGDKLGYAAFGKVVGGMGVVRSILAAPTFAKGGAGAMKGQMLKAPIRIIAAHRAGASAARPASR